jgi:hypothetical protein
MGGGCDTGTYRQGGGGEIDVSPHVSLGSLSIVLLDNSSRWPMPENARFSLIGIIVDGALSAAQQSPLAGPYIHEGRIDLTERK